MTDAEILMMMNSRNESALGAIESKYGVLVRRVVQQILDNAEDVEECLNDVYLNVWNAIPPARPDNLRAYICKVARNLALDRYRFASRGKRASPHIEKIATELVSAVTEDWATPLVEQVAFDQVLNQFLRELPPKYRSIFLKRYWLLMDVDEIAQTVGVNTNTVKTVLFRTRQCLKKKLDKEGIKL